MSLCLVTMFMNESHILSEWITHYLNQGVDKIFMIDNASTDNYLDALSPFIGNNTVDLVIDGTKHAQSQCINKHFLDKCKKYDWVIVCDLDEFIYARKGFKTIKDYLKTVSNNVSQVFIPWKLFGSNGFNTLDKIQPKSVIQSFTKRINYDKEDGFQGVIKADSNKYSFTKCIVRTKYLISFDVHSHKTSNKNYITTDINNSVNIHNNNSFAKIDEKILQDSCLHLNHYANQSLDWFMRIKATRGDNCNKNCDNVRGEGYFFVFDIVSNDIDDLELYKMY